MAWKQRFDKLSHPCILAMVMMYWQTGLGIVYILPLLPVSLCQLCDNIKSAYLQVVLEHQWTKVCSLKQVLLQRPHSSKPVWKILRDHLRQQRFLFSKPRLKVFWRSHTLSVKKVWLCHTRSKAVRFRPHTRCWSDHRWWQSKGWFTDSDCSRARFRCHCWSENRCQCLWKLYRSWSRQTVLIAASDDC